MTSHRTRDESLRLGKGTKRVSMSYGGHPDSWHLRCRAMIDGGWLKVEDEYAHQKIPSVEHQVKAYAGRETIGLA